jgi:hypothetical protein
VQHRTKLKERERDRERNENGRWKISFQFTLLLLCSLHRDVVLVNASKYGVRRYFASDPSWWMVMSTPVFGNEWLSEYIFDILPVWRTDGRTDGKHAYINYSSPSFLKSLIIKCISKDGTYLTPLPSQSLLVTHTALPKIKNSNRFFPPSILIFRPKCYLRVSQHPLHNSVPYNFSLAYSKKVKQSRYRPEQAQRVDRGRALTFRDLGTRWGVWSA